MTPREHVLKTVDPFWEDIHNGSKTFELRYNDRAFQRGDVLLLKRWSQEHQCAVKPYDPLRRVVTYVLSGERWGLRDGWVCLGIAAED